MNMEKIDLRTIMVETFIEAAEADKKIAVVVSDSTSTSKISPFQKLFPEKLINVGIAEQTLVGVAAGLALGGHIAITANAAPFLVARSNEQVKNDICYSNTNVKMVGLNAGVSYGPLASTHHAIDDISIMRTLGNVKIFAPSDPIDVKQIFQYAIDYKGPVYIRMDSAKFPVLHAETYKFIPGKADILLEGNDVSIIALGSVVHEAYEAANELKKESISAEVINLQSIRPLDRDSIINSIIKTRNVITVEEHSINGGVGSIVAEIIAEENINTSFKRLGIHDGEFSKAGPRNEIRKYYKIDSEGIIESVKKLLEPSKVQI